MKFFNKYMLALMLMMGVSNAIRAQIPVMVLEVENEKGEIEKIEFPLETNESVTFFGKNNVQDGDYVTCVIEARERTDFSLSVLPTSSIANEECTLGLLIGEEPGVSLENCLFAVKSTDGPLEVKYEYNKGKANFSSTDISKYTIVKGNKSSLYLNLGQKYYVKGYVDLGAYGIYLSKEQMLVVNNTVSGIYDCVGGLHQYTETDYVAVDYDIDAAFAMFGDVLGAPTTTAVWTLADCWVKTNRETLEGLDHIACVDGNVCYKYLTESEVKNGYNIICEAAKGSKVNSVESVNRDIDAKGNYMYFKSCGEIKYVDTDAEWNIPDNRYICAYPSSQTSNPTVVFDIASPLLPNRTYNLIIRFAPDTETENAEERKQNRCYISKYECKEDAPQAYAASEKLANPDGSGNYFETSANEITTFTIPFAVNSLTAKLGIQLQSQITSKLATTHTRAIRLIDIKVEQAE